MWIERSKLWKHLKAGHNHVEFIGAILAMTGLGYVASHEKVFGLITILSTLDELADWYFESW